MLAKLSQLPVDLHVPIDDGAASHLQGSRLPGLALPGTHGASVKLVGLAGCWVIQVCPMTGRPDVPLPDGWDGIPGARSGRPQSCGLRDYHAELRANTRELAGAVLEAAPS